MQTPDDDDLFSTSAESTFSTGDDELEIGDDSLADEKEEDEDVKKKLPHEQMMDKLTDVQKKFREGRDRERRQRKQLNDSEFWFAVYFPSRESKMEFLRKSLILDKLDCDKYVDGEELATLMGIKLTTPKPEFKPVITVKSRWADLSLPLPEKKAK